MSRQTPDWGIAPNDYSALSNFLRGYLHQDATADYGSAEAAARQFRKDADERETSIVHSELDRLLNETSRSTLAQLNHVLQRLGCAWEFRTREELQQVRSALK